MSEFKCEYHSKRTAIDKCNRCHRMICLEDKNLVPQGRSFYHSTNSFSHSYYNVILCSMCYYDAAVEGKNLLGRGINTTKTMILVVPIFIILLFAFFSFIFSSASDGGDFFVSSALQFMLFPMLIFVLIAFLMIRGSGSIMSNMMDQNYNRAKITKDKLVSSMDPSLAKQYVGKQLACFNCGDVIDIDSLFCMSCGDSTKEERAQAGL